MPELPEIETIKIYLKQYILQKNISNIVIYNRNLRYKISNNLETQIIKSNIISVQRSAKYLIINLDNNQSLIFHLGMSGILTLQAMNYIPIKHDHIIIILDNTYKLVFNDPRRFGALISCNTSELNQHKLLKKGVEPLSSNFNNKYLYQCLQKKKTAIKNCIMDNKIVVGIGNIYACESLFLSKLNPTIDGYKVTFDKTTQLVKAIKIILSEAIKLGGTSIKDFINVNGKLGYFSQQLKVYDRQNQKCNNCNYTIKKLKQINRSTFFCPNCQT